jgi:hypothetical protein
MRQSSTVAFEPPKETERKIPERRYAWWEYPGRRPDLHTHLLSITNQEENHLHIIDSSKGTEEKN